MWRPASVVTPVSVEPISLEEVKARLKIDAVDDDASLTAMIKESRDFAERYCGARIAPIGLSLQCSAFADLELLPERPLKSIDSLSYVDVDGEMQAVRDSVFEIIGQELDARIVLKADQVWPSIKAGTWITLSATFGFDPVPPAIQRALIIHVKDAYDASVNKPAGSFTAIDELLCNFR